MINVGDLIGENYKIKSKLGESGVSEVWLADDMKQDREAVVKTLDSNAITGSMYNILRFQNEIAAVAKLNNPGVAKIYEGGETENHVQYIAMEYLQGKTLQELLDDGIKFSLNEIVFIMYRICEALSHVHESEIIHMDLRPGNIFIEYKESGAGSGNIIMKSIKLIDFGLVHVVEHDYSKTEELAGIISYLSPEQTGAISRKIDERSDLYSAGSIFYRLTTGKLPRKEDGSAGVSEFPAGIETPEILQKIVLKLLEREPEQRYQSAEGLKNDLRKYREGDHDFTLGMDDGDIKLTFRSALVGRNAEFTKLKSLHEDAVNGKGSICFVGGEEGRGKTRLSGELREIVIEKNPFIEGVCISGINQTPYGPFKEALNRYIAGYQAYTASQKKDVAVKLRRKLTNMGNVVLQLNPGMKEILGMFPPLGKLEADREMTRFNTVLSKFFIDMAETEGGLVLLLDDLQWADEGSIALLDHITKNIASSKLLIIANFRDNEVTAGHPLHGLINRIKENNYPISEISLKPFGRVTMQKFTEEILRESSDVTTEISDFVMQKSIGNPRFATGLLRQVVEEEVLTWHKGRWNLSAKKLKEIDVSSDIVDTILKKTSLLSNTEKELISHASVFGREIDSDILYEISSFPQEDIYKTLEKAIGFQLMERGLYDRNRIYFVHDRIRDHFYELIHEKEKKEVHSRIAEMMEQANRRNLDEVIYKLANHYLASGNKLKGAEFAYRAGTKAKDNYANEDALTFFRAAQKITTDTNYQGEISNAQCMNNIADTLLVMGRYDEGLQAMEELLKNTSENMEKSVIYNKMSQAYYNKGDFDNSVKYGNEGLALLGVKMPAGKASLILSTLKEVIAHFFVAHRAKEKSSVKDAEKFQLVYSFFVVLNWVYLLSDRLSFINVMFKGLNMMAKNLGVSKELAKFWNGYGGAMMSLGKYELSEKFHKKGLAMQERFENDWGIASAYQMMGYMYEWRGDYELAKKTLNNSMEMFDKLGDTKEYHFAMNGIIHSYFYSADYKTMLELNNRYSDYAVKTNDDYSLSASNCYFIQYYRERGDYQKAEEYARDGIATAKHKENWFNYSRACIELGATLVEDNRPEEAIAMMQEARKLYETHHLLKQYSGHVYQVLARALILAYLKNKDNLGKAEQSKELAKIGKATKLAVKTTKKLPTHYGEALRMRAKYLILQGSTKRVDHLFKQSIKHCADISRKFEHAVSLYEYGVFLENTVKSNDYTRQYETAYYIFKEIGAKKYEQKLAALLGKSGSDAA